MFPLHDEEFVRIYREKEAETPNIGEPLDENRMENIAYVMHMAMNSAQSGDLNHARICVAYAVLWAANYDRFVDDKIEEHKAYVDFFDHGAEYEDEDERDTRLDE